MPDDTSRVPKYRCKKSNGRKYACVSLPDGTGGRRDVILGKYGSKESRTEYARVIAEWEAAGRRLPHGTAADLTVNELILAFWPHAEKHYRHVDGRPTGELNDYRLSLRTLKTLYGHTAAKDFGPLALKAVRDQLIRQPITIRVKTIDPETGKTVWTQKVIRQGLARGVINQRIGRIRRLFKWGVESELIPASVHHGLAAVGGLQRGRTDARETEKVKPVSIALVEETLPYLVPIVADMVRLLLLTGMRAGELVIMRAVDIDRAGPIWLYKPASHKNSYRGQGRTVALGPKCQEIIPRHLKANVEAFLFSPRDAMDAFRREQRARRKTKVQPSQQNRSKGGAKLGYRYTVGSMARAVRRACEKHGLPHWHLHQLRHTAATMIRRQYGIDAARAVLGHTAPTITETYAEIDMGKAAEIAAKLG